MAVVDHSTENQSNWKQGSKTLRHYTLLFWMRSPSHTLRIIRIRYTWISSINGYIIVLLQTTNPLASDLSQLFLLSKNANADQLHPKSPVKGVVAIIWMLNATFVKFNLVVA